MTILRLRGTPVRTGKVRKTVRVSTGRCNPHRATQNQRGLHRSRLTPTPQCTCWARARRQRWKKNPASWGSTRRGRATLQHQWISKVTTNEMQQRSASRTTAFEATGIAGLAHALSFGTNRGDLTRSMTITVHQAMYSTMYPRALSSWPDC